MSEDWQRENIRIRRQPITGSREALVMNTAIAFYGSKFNQTVALMLVDLLEPLHIAVTTGSETQVQDAIARSLDEIRGWHREALNQCRDYGHRSAHRAELTDNLPADGAVDQHEVESLNGTGTVEKVSHDEQRD
jgi:hypothetical protein